MARNGSGTFSPSVDFTTEAGSPPIEISKLDTAIDDLGDEITNSIAADGQTDPTANLPMNGFKHTDVANAAARNQYASGADVQDQDLIYFVDSGAADAYVLTPSPSISAYEEGQRLVFRATNTNTGTSTLNVNALGTRIIYTPDGNALAAGMIVDGGLYEVTYDANPSPDRWVLTSPHSLTPIVDSGNQDLDGVLTSEGVTVRNTGGTDAVAITHDGTDVNLINTNTTDWNIAGLSGSVWVRDGAALKISDSGDTDFVSIGHDGTDLNASFTNTSDWSISSLSGNVWIRDGAGLKLSDATDADSVTLAHDGTDLNASFVNTSVWNLKDGIELRVLDSSNTDYLRIIDTGSQSQITTNNNNIYISPVGTNSVILAATAVSFRSGTSTYHYDSTNADYCRQYHDGTDFNTTFNGTTQWNISGTVNLTDNTIIRPVIRDYGITSSTPTISSGAITFNLVTSNAFQVTLSANITSVTLSNPPASGTYGECIIKFTQDGTGSRTVTGWPASVKWNGGTAPTIATTATTGVGIVSLKTWNAGTTWFGDYTQSYS